ncbi:MAG TPA: carboxypeptidase-like regulatory domain-containing protein [Xanthomonadales bacterium]|nr:carboxypeptidase-like regulatory domain-containing protein [Xanthomonadales bacterium]
MTGARRLAAAFFAVAFTCAAAAQAGTTGTIEGRATTQAGRPIPNAAVELFSLAQTLRTTTDGGGYFHFLSLYPDSYLLAVRHNGYFGYLTGWFEVHADQVTSCNARLEVQFLGEFLVPRHGNKVVTCSY